MGRSRGACAAPLRLSPAERPAALPAAQSSAEVAVACLRSVPMRAVVNQPLGKGLQGVMLWLTCAAVFDACVPLFARLHS